MSKNSYQLLIISKTTQGSIKNIQITEEYALKILLILCISLTILHAKSQSEYPAVPIIMVTTGAGIIGMWTIDIIKGEHIEYNDSFFKARDKRHNQLMWPHWVAEYATGIGLIVSAYGVYTDQSWGRDVALLSLGSTLYTSINSQSWTL